MEEKREELEKWQGKATAELKGLQSHQIWPLLSDFCSAHKWLPHLDTCYPVSGVSGEPGLVRYCGIAKFSTTPAPPDHPHLDDDDGVKEAEIRYAKERLIAINQEEKWLSYDIVENNAGFGSYVATVRLIDAGDEGSCVIEWTYEADPVVGWRSEDLLSFIQVAVLAMATRMEDFLAHPNIN